MPSVGLLIAAAVATAAEPADPARHWAFQTLARPAVPRVKSSARTPVDAFLLARLERVNLGFASEVDRATLIRRLSLDLIGLPPTPDEIAAFEADRSPLAYERLVDRLLASPHFGEKWGRHWLDNAGYVDVTGGDNDADTVKLGENKWLYRDYVIDAFNGDRPFDRFLAEQVAGDELVPWRTAKEITPKIRRNLIATGFLRTAADDTDENELNTLDIRYGVLHRTLEVMAGNLLGLTVQCAKCHDHKFEPILQADYYRIQALIQPALNPDRWLQPKQRLLPALTTAARTEAEAHNKAIDQAVADLSKQLEKAKATKGETAKLQKQIDEAKAKRRSWEHWQAVYEADAPTPTRLLKRGEVNRLGDEVAPGFLAVLSRDPACSASPAAGSSGRRLALAHWLNDAQSPAGALVLRVRVNRIWRHLFGRGLVESTENFGLSGSKPSHPELLDWLASEFLRDGRRLKPLLRTLVTSSAYRQRSDGPGRGATVDPDNQLLWRMRLRRLDAEGVRDSILAVGGTLDRSLGGPPIPVDVKADGSMTSRDGDRPRRSIYLLQRRNYHPTLLSVFDQPVLTTNCTARSPSAVVLQPLAMLNDEFVSRQASKAADHIKRAKPTDELGMAFRQILGRWPTEAERTIARELMQGQPASDRLGGLCHVLFNTSEFLYVP